jgi:luciferase-like monooxygenase
MANRLREALCQVDDVIESESAFKDELAFWANGKEIAHFEGDHAVDIRLTRRQISARRAELRADPRVVLRPGSSDWLTVEFHSEEDERFVVGLVEIAAAAHRPADGSTAAPPPQGSDLARRRRFH